MRVRLRPTVAADLPHVIGEPLPHRIRALTALAGDQVLGVGGIGHKPDGTVIAFVAMTPEGRRYPVAIHRAGLAAMQMIRESGVPMVLATAAPDVPRADAWLRRLGFREEIQAGESVFVWRRHVE